MLRSNHVAQCQSECTNLVIEHFGIRNSFDWLFVLDSDEFLPFKDRDAFNRFLRSHADDNVLSFRWRNGVPFHDQDTHPPASPIDCDSIRFFREKSIHTSAFPNLAKIGGNFLVPTGSHQISYAKAPWLSRLRRRANGQYYSALTVDEPLFHVLAFNKADFVRKIQNYVKQMEYRVHVSGQGGWSVRDCPSELSEDEWLWYVANFRVSDSAQYQDATPVDFEPVAIFDHLDKDSVRALRDRILSFPLVEEAPQEEAEKRYLEYKVDDTAIIKNMEWFTVTSDDEIVSVVPR